MFARRQNSTWDIVERGSDDANAHEGFRKKLKPAYRAGRDEVLRQMTADGMPENEIVEVTDLSPTRTRAINLARVRELTADMVDIAEASATSGLSPSGFGNSPGRSIRALQPTRSSLSVGPIARASFL